MIDHIREIISKTENHLLLWNESGDKYVSKSATIFLFHGYVTVQIGNLIINERMVERSTRYYVRKLWELVSNKNENKCEYEEW